MELQLEKLVELLVVVVVRVEEVLVLVEAPSFLVAAAAVARFFSLSSPIDVRYRVQPFLFV